MNKLWSGIWSWQSQWSPSQWEAFGTMTTAVIAIGAIAIARRQVIEARRLREEQAKPFVVVSFQRNSVVTNWVDLVVENIGNTVARNVKISFSERLETAHKMSININESQLLTTGIHVMPPGMKISAMFDSGPERYTSKLPMVYHATVTYEGIGRTPEEEEYTLDIGIFYGLHNITEYGLHDVAKSLREIKKSIAGWSSGSSIRVSAHDADYADWSNDWQYKHGGTWPSLASQYPAGRPAPTKFDHLREGKFGAIRRRIRRHWDLLRDLRRDEIFEESGRPDIALQRRISRGEEVPEIERLVERYRAVARKLWAAEKRVRSRFISHS